MGTSNLEKNDSFLTETDVIRLKHMFHNKDAYMEYLETLWALRKSAANICNGNANSPYYRIVKLTNELIGAILHDDVDVIRLARMIEGV